MLNSVKNWIIQKPLHEDTVTGDTVDCRQEVASNESFDKNKSWGVFLYSLGAKMSTSAAKTVERVRGQIYRFEDNAILDHAPILSTFQKEQAEFVEKEKVKERRRATQILPWLDNDCSPDEREKLKKDIFDLANDERHFLRAPPTGAQFEFDMTEYEAVAAEMLRMDERLQSMRFKLVPKKVKEERFWCNYFYRISLITQTARLRSIIMAGPHQSHPGSIFSNENFDRRSNESRKSQGSVNDTTLKPVSSEVQPSKVSSDEKPAQKSESSEESYDRLSEIEGISKETKPCPPVITEKNEDVDWEAALERDLEHISDTIDSECTEDIEREIEAELGLTS